MRLANGVVANTASRTSRRVLCGQMRRSQSPPEPPDDQLTLLFRPDPPFVGWTIRQQCLAAGAAAAPHQADLGQSVADRSGAGPRLQLRNGDMVRLAVGDASVTMPAWIMPGQAADCVVALLGFGGHACGHRRQLGLASTFIR